MTTLIPANTLQNILKSADTLWQAGYKCELVTGDGLFRVFNPTKGCSYVVETRNGAKTCECPSFNRWGICKHGQGIVLLIQCQMSSYYLRHQQALQQAKRMQGEALVHIAAYADRLDDACWELECALSAMVGGEFLASPRLTGYMAEITEERKAA